MAGSEDPAAPFVEAVLELLDADGLEPWQQVEVLEKALLLARASDLGAGIAEASKHFNLGS